MRSIRILGVDVTPLTIRELCQLVLSAVRDGRKSVIANHNLHSVRLYHRNDEFRQLFALADAVHIDGMPLVRWARLMGHDVATDHRVTYVDWLPALLDMAEREGLRLFFLGSKPGVADKAAAAARSRRPGLSIETAHGYFDRAPGSTENLELLDRIERFSPHILIVGMGMPVQEQWIASNLGSISANVILPAGASLDYLAEEVPTPPRWMGRAGLEWLYRLRAEPRRLAHRYLVEPWGLLPLFLSDLRTRISDRRSPYA